MSLRVMVVLGTRPEATKLAPVILELRRRPAHFRVLLVSTGQHQDMVPQHLAGFGLKPDCELAVMRAGSPLASLTARTLEGLDPLLEQHSPGLVLAEGDTAAVFAAGLAAFYRRLPVAHVEAGLRTCHRHQPFPEEINRRLMSIVTDYHLAPTPRARQNLLAEGVPAGRICVTGNTAVDAVLLAAAGLAPLPATVPQQALRARMVLVTAHRRESWGEPLRQICLGLADLLAGFRDVHVVFSLHPNPIVRQTVSSVLGGVARCQLIDAPGYFEFVKLMQAAHLILTDSGGIQEEAPALGRPVLVLREVTERAEGLAAGCARLVGTDRRRLLEGAAEVLSDGALWQRMAQAPNPYGDGQAAPRIADALAHWFGLSPYPPEEFAP